VLLADADLLLPVLFVLGLLICIGVQKLHYNEFTEVFNPVSRRRVIVNDDRAILRAVEALASCTDFRTLCQILKEILHAEGMHATRVKNLGSDGYPMALLHSLRYDAKENGIWNGPSATASPIRGCITSSCLRNLSRRWAMPLC
jgi:hypothetical protein